jgi:hypothetical protein
VKVVEREHERFSLTKLSQHLAQLAEQTAAVTWSCRRVGPKRREITLESVAQNRKWQLRLELGAATGQRPVTTFLASPQELRDQRGLSDPWLSRDVDRAATALRELVQREVERGQLGITPDEPGARFVWADERPLRRAVELRSPVR